ncbi:unnamed protein product [Peniophora sp. CBMAI 1063]|nr:unnamed protein product [Peniophora sp. CBMAI 1063]
MSRSTAMESREYVNFEIISLLFDGMYLLEMISFMNFDWALLTRNKHGGRTSLLGKSVKATYLLCRYCSLISCVAELYSFFNVSRGSLSCEVLFRIVTGTAILAATFSSALIAIRAVVVWVYDVRLTSLIVLVLLAVLAINIRTYVILSSSYDPINMLCALDHMHVNLPNVIALLSCDSIILAALFAGLYRWHEPGYGEGSFSLWSLLWRQGVLYLALASTLEIPALVFLALNRDCKSTTPSRDICPTYAP